MGMLVDNAIVITDGIMVDMKRGFLPDALVNITKKTAWALLGATTIGILTFYRSICRPIQPANMSVTFYRIGCIAMAELDIGAGLCSDPGRPGF